MGGLSHALVVVNDTGVVVHVAVPEIVNNTSYNVY